ncbi:related to 3-oxoacyl-[acyl-carrier-protein] synthase I [Desulfotalea psychrophila LSv54]|uniref:Related to 3-oxoacyl-[acyl-carrier-protein] synthase I n=1 Tax=Desulfotalea psychrophila (strain LSv54 / DSM 12343) TaxID=177439 RepID=Q6AM37_DESPS|nr:related to 3-oxoacyl-[acyl-carrier-protein] synthase I [Desulfotalea psychrophila LSv54]
MEKCATVNKRVVITGRGAVSPFGLGVPTLLENLWQGCSAIRSIPEWQDVAGLGSHLAAPVPDFDLKILPRIQRRTMGKMAMFATIASQEAVADSGIDKECLSSGDIGVAIGSTTGSPAAYETFYLQYLVNSSLQGIKSGEFFKSMGHSCAANVSLTLGIKGEQWGPASACTSSSQAIGLGYILIKAGRQQAMLCGGAEETHPSVTGVFDLLGAASRRHQEPESSCRPFAKDRDGVVCGGGSGVLVLEELASAQARGAKIYGEIVGFGNVTDSGHIANPDTHSMQRAMSRAMSEAGIIAADIDYVNAHATGTELGDIAEARAIASVLGPLIPVSSFKGHLGHTLGASGALEIIAVLEMMQRQEIIPTRNLSLADPRCNGISLIREKSSAFLKTILKNNFALGGVNTSLAIRNDIYP